MGLLLLLIAAYADPAAMPLLLLRLQNEIAAGPIGILLLLLLLLSLRLQWRLTCSCDWRGYQLLLRLLLLWLPQDRLLAHGRSAPIVARLLLLLLSCPTVPIALLRWSLAADAAGQTLLLFLHGSGP